MVGGSFRSSKGTNYSNGAFTWLGSMNHPEENDHFNMVVNTSKGLHPKSEEVFPTVLKLRVLEFMCCNNQNCLPPAEVNYSFKLEGIKTAAVVSKDTTKTLVTVPAVTVKDTAATASQKAQAPVAAAKAEIKPAASNDDFTGKDRTLLWFFLQAFLWGLLAILTPCVFPMIPLTVSYFMKSGAKGKVQAMVYGLSIIAIYVIFGVLVSVLFGADFGNWLSTHWLPNVLFFLIFVVFAASFFGYFEITVPGWLVNKSFQQEDKGAFVGTIFMAFTLVLVSFSFTGPIVGTVLVQAVGGQILKPVIGMPGFSLAFAIPFTLSFPQWLKQMPKSGGWLNTIKVVIGFIELAFALKFLNVLIRPTTGESSTARSISVSGLSSLP